MQAPIQATRRPAAGLRGQRRDNSRRNVGLVLLASLAFNVAQLLWHQAYAEDVEKAMQLIRQERDDAKAELIDTQRRLANWQADYTRQLPQD